MNKTGFVGFGNMGGTMLNALLKAGSMPEDEIMVFTRTKEKLKPLLADYPKVEVAKDSSEIGSKCRRVFICTGTAEVKQVLVQLAERLPEDAHVITMAGTIEMRCLENVFRGRITRIMPTMVSEVGEGVTLVFHNEKVQPKDKEFVRVAFGKIGRVKEIKEDQFDLSADLTSCAPAFFAAILDVFGKTAAKYSDFSQDELKQLILPTCYGTTKLLMEKQWGYEGLISKVATRGGISEEGVKVLQAHLPEVFDKLLAVTLEKRSGSKKLMRKQYGID